MLETLIRRQSAKSRLMALRRDKCRVRNVILSRSQMVFTLPYCVVVVAFGEPLLVRNKYRS
jgi:ribosomal protein S27E